MYHKWLHCPHPFTLQEEHFLECRQKDRPLNITKPSHLLIVDYAQGTNLYSGGRSKMLNHDVIKHRHIPLTITLLAQSWVGIPHVICLNTTLFCVYKTHAKTQLKHIYDTFGMTVKSDQFESIGRQAAEKKCGFLFIHKYCTKTRIHKVL